MPWWGWRSIQGRWATRSEDFLGFLSDSERGVEASRGCLRRHAISGNSLDELSPAQHCVTHMIGQVAYSRFVVLISLIFFSRRRRSAAYAAYGQTCRRKHPQENSLIRHGPGNAVGMLRLILRRCAPSASLSKPRQRTAGNSGSLVEPLKSIGKSPSHLRGEITSAPDTIPRSQMYTASSLHL